MNNTLVIGIIVTGIALLFGVISTAIPYWWKSDSINFGLFKICADLLTVGSICSDIEGTDWIKATRAMMILSILSLGGSLLLAILFGFVLKDKQILALGAASMSFAAAALALLGVIIFGAKIPLNKYGNGSLHAGFGLGIIAVIVAFVAGGIIFMSRNRNV